MTRVDKTMLLAVLAGAAIAAVSASCANSCSGHGSCGAHDRCSCYSMWEGTDCSRKTCPSGMSSSGDYEVCSGRGVCDSTSGACSCAEGYTGYNCGRSSCPNDCSGHGKCTGAESGTRQCVCDGYYTGADCSFRQCPRGDDPLTTEIECQGVSSGSQSHEVQEITLTADKQLSGEMTLTYTDAYGQAWTTMPISVGGDLEFDMRMSGGTAGCSLTYKSATLTSEKFRGTGDHAKTVTDFAATEFSVPSVAAASMTVSDCDELSAAAMEALIEQNGAVKNVKVTKSGDANTGTARFHVSIGDLNFQNENDGMEIGVFSMTGRSDTTFHAQGDRSQAIKDALQALPYNVVPSVDVSRVKVDGGSDYADSSVVYGNMVQQKYRVTFSDAANAGNQVALQCNAEGCDTDGCAPRYKGVTHKRYISTKYGSDPMDPTGGVTDYRTAIVATGQGSWWLRSHSLDVRTKSPFNSGTYFVHWDLGNGKTSSASFPYDANEATIQTALRTIEGWGGVSVSCMGTAGFAGRDYFGVSAAHFGLECKVTYAKGFDDGGKMPTMTYENIHQGMLQANVGGTKTHVTDLGASASIGFDCVNEMCVISNIGHSAGDYTSKALFYSAVDADGSRGRATTTDKKPGKADNFIGYVYIRKDDGTAGSFPDEGTYEIVRSSAASTLNTLSLADLIIYAPGVADMNKATAFGTTTSTVYLYKATPLMPMWPSFSNSIALHDTSWRMIYSPDAAEPYHVDTATGLNTWHNLPNANIHYGMDGAVSISDNSLNLFLTPGTTCNSILTRLNGFTGNGPYPSLASADGFSICDCKRTAMEVAPYEVEYTVTCPGWLGYLINNDAVQVVSGQCKMNGGGADPTGCELSSCTDAALCDISLSKQYSSALCTAATDVAGSNAACEFTEASPPYASLLLTQKLTNDPSLALATTDSAIARQYSHHRRLSPERSLEQLVAVGDTITVTASGANTNKQFKVKSFAYDNMWGDGNKGSAIWSSKTGYLGGDHGNGFAQAVSSLDSSIDYVSYGDFVPFLKVDPAPSDDYLVTEMYAEGTNGTHFTRTLEDISTKLAETATLKVYDKPATEADHAAAASQVPFNARQLSGTFQLIYDGELSPVIPASSSANQVMEYLSQMTSLEHVPQVKKTQGGTEIGDTVEAVAELTDYVSWVFTFDKRQGDAKKLTFKYTDAVGDEQKTSNIIGSGGSRLVNEVGELAHAVLTSRKNRYVNNKIVMTYSSGSAFYDEIDADYDGAALAADVQGETSSGVKRPQAWVQDELAMDVVPGTSITVSSAEVHHVWFYQVINSEGNQETIDPVKGCGADDEKNLHLIVEYEGMFSQPQSICDGTDVKKWASPTTTTGTDKMEGKIVANIPSLKGLTILIEAMDLETGVTDSVTGVSENDQLETTFGNHFPWAKTHSGSARARVSFTLPMGAKGDSFKVHLQRGLKTASGVSRYSTDAKNHDFRLFTHRERNNNGRTFTVTKAYENKVSDLLSVSRIGSADTSKGGLAFIPVPKPASVATGYDDSSVCGANVNGKMNPGTYYNVPLLYATGANGNGAGALAMVVVGGDKQIHEVQITSGGSSAYATGATLHIADTRLHADMANDVDDNRCKIILGDLSTEQKSNHLLKSITNGAHTGMACGTIITGNTCTGHSDCTDVSNPTKTSCYGVTTQECTFSSGCGSTGVKPGVVAANPFAIHQVPSKQDATATMTSGKRYTMECDADYVPTKVTVTQGGNGGASGASRSTVSGTNDPALAVAGTGVGGAHFTTDCMNDHYYQFGFFSTGTPRWNRDLSQNNADMGVTPKDQQVSLYGMRNHMQYQYDSGTLNMATDTFYGLARDTFSDLNSGMGFFDVGYSIHDQNAGDLAADVPQLTASVIAGENGQGGNAVTLAPMMEHAEKYAYIGKGFDKLTVSPMPDPMSSQKVTITYTGPSAGCTVTEVDRGTHESSECSGRGNCDYTTGTCLCDAGYTLEACSEQTVLV